MPYLKRDDAEIYYEVHGDGAPFLFCSVTGQCQSMYRDSSPPPCCRSKLSN